MRNFYRNGGFFSHLLKGSGLYWILGVTGLIVLSLAAMMFLPEEDVQEALSPSDSLSSDVTASDVTDLISQTESSSVPSDEPVGGEVSDSVWMILPVSGTVGTDFSLTVPVFSQTMNDWRVHQGIDFLTEESVDVMAAADGMVDQVYWDELMGLTVEILHADGTISVYQSLAEEADVIAGQEVKQGDVIGATGTSADSECLEGNHLHFALVRGGVYLDPNEYFAS